MNKVIVHIDPVTGITCYTRCVPWARLVAGDPPLPLEDAQPKVRDRESYLAVADRIEWAETETEFATRVADKILASIGISYTIVDDDPAILDGDRTFRNALKLDGASFSHDMAKARTIWMDRIRQVRDVELAKLDVETIKALGIGDTVRRDAVEAQKQVLRDLTQTFDLSSYATTDQLKAAWPPQLPRPVDVTPAPIQAAERPR